MVCRYTAGAMNLPFFPLRSYEGTDLPKANPLIRPIKSPYSDEQLYAVPALKPDVAIIHAQRADAAGDTQVWGLLGCQKEAAFAADRVIVVVEELVDEAVIRADPNRTILPGLVVDAVVVEPFGAHPSYAQGYYDRDNAFYLEWDAISRDADSLDRWLDEWVFGVADRTEYVAKMGEQRSCAPADAGAVRLSRLRRVPLADESGQKTTAHEARVVFGQLGSRLISAVWRRPRSGRRRGNARDWEARPGSYRRSPERVC